jgi:ribosomal protein S18 acetylase RimI-like enzyme
MVMMHNKTSWMIRPLSRSDITQWQTCYRLYADFYEVPMNDAILKQTWEWLMDPTYPLEGMVAITEDGSIAGFAHYRAYAEPLMGKEACYLDDLYVLSAYRKQGIARALITQLTRVAQERGWPLIRWITANNNAAARTLYDQMAQITPWVTYDIDINNLD